VTLTLSVCGTATALLNYFIDGHQKH